MLREIRVLDGSGQDGGGFWLEERTVEGKQRIGSHQELSGNV